MIQLNEQQRMAAEFEGKHLLVLAGAGTGKTGTIIARAD
ncbi:MAG TPA: UvrD-helicase domain-containing protein, partial [Bacteroidales bacterium]|nr:UvrD-helicase domain-containing protein [Bacteroidales bacterium]